MYNPCWRHAGTFKFLKQSLVWWTSFCVVRYVEIRFSIPIWIPWYRTLNFMRLSLGGCFKYFLFSPRKLGKIPIFTNIFQMGWFNQQPVLFGWMDLCEDDLSDISSKWVWLASLGLANHWLASLVFEATLLDMQQLTAVNPIFNSSWAVGRLTLE